MRKKIYPKIKKNKTKGGLNMALVAGVRNASPGTVAGMLIRTATSKAFWADHAKVEAFVSQKRCFPAQWEDWTMW